MEKRFITAGTIAKRTGIALPTVFYLIRSRNIKPEGRAGRLRVFNERVIEQIKLEHDACKRT